MLVARWAVELLDRPRIEAAGDRQLIRVLESFYRLRDLGIVFEVGSVTAEPEPFPQQRHARVFHRHLRVELEQGPVGDLVRGRSLAAHLREHGLELPITLMRGAEIVERRAGIGGLADLCKHLGWIGRDLRQLDIQADAAVGKATGLQVAGIGEHGLGELELRLGQGVWAQAGKRGRVVIVDVEPVGIGALEPCNDGAGTGILDALI